MRDPYATHELGLADVARRDPLDDLLNLLIFFQHRDLPAVAPITGSRPRGPPGQKSESDPRARSDTEAPTARSPTPCSPATSHDQVDPASAGDPPNIFSAESAPEQGTLAHLIIGSSKHLREHAVGGHREVLAVVDPRDRGRGGPGGVGLLSDPCLAVSGDWALATRPGGRCPQGWAVGRDVMRRTTAHPVEGGGSR